MSPRGPGARLPLKRRRLGVTDYRLRTRLLRSGLPRLAVRISNKHVCAQVLIAELGGDKTVASAHSGELMRYGWRLSGKSLSAAYLVGLLAGYRALGKGVKSAVLDMGLRTPTGGSRVFAALKGALEAGLEVPHGPETLPEDSRLEGEHVSRYLKAVAAAEQPRLRQFSRYIGAGVPPGELKAMLRAAEQAIKAEFAGRLG